MNDKIPGLKPLLIKAEVVLQVVQQYSILLFVLLIASLYGFVMLRINSLSNAQPSNTSVTTQVQAAHVPHIDKSVVQQLESLQDNSVNVQGLFNEARSNPFQ